MKQKHTPGPWRGGYNVIGADGTVVCTINRPSGGNVAVENANCRLICSAPELLAALKALLTVSLPRDISGQRFVEQAMAAVAKADGTTNSPADEP